MTASVIFRRRLPTRWLALLALAPAFVLPAQAQLRLGPLEGSGPAAASSRSSAPRAADFIVAVVNSEPITNNEVRARMLRMEQELTQRGGDKPARIELARQALNQLITERAQLQLAKELGLQVDEAMVDRAEQNIARQNGMDLAEFRRRLEGEGLTPETFRQDLRRQLLLSRLRQREIEPRVKISEGELEQFIREQRRSQDASSQELNLAQILVAVPENAPPALVQELRDKAESVRKRAVAGEDFSALAREFSDAPGAADNGGVLGLRTADRYPTLFVQAARSLEPGAISQVVRSGAGFHVLKVLEKRSDGLPGATVTQVHARHILLRPGPNLSEAQARQKLEEYKKRIESGQADFAELAREHSQDGSAREGGDLGWANPGTLVPEFEDALAGLSPGQIAEPVQTRFGLHLIQLLDRRQHRLSESEQRELARNLLREKKLDEEYRRWAEDVRGRAFVELREAPQY